MSCFHRVNLLLKAMRANSARIVFLLLMLASALVSVGCIATLCRLAGEVFAQQQVQPLRYRSEEPCVAERRRLWLAGDVAGDPCRAVRLADGCVSYPAAWIDYQPHPCHASTLTVFRVERPAGLYCWQDCYGWRAITAPQRASR
jgi:hypothetical protein